MRPGKQVKNVACHDIDLSEANPLDRPQPIHRRHRPWLYMLVLGVFVMIHFLKSS
jgi:hypothetical protein